MLSPRTKKIKEIDKEAHCPTCKEEMKTFVSPKQGVTDITVGMITACVGCYTFLRVAGIDEKEIKMKELTLEEISELPDEDRIGLQRLRNMMEKYKISDRKTELERFTFLTARSNEHREKLGEMMSEAMKEVFGEELGAVLLMMDTKGNWAGLTSNLPDGMAEGVVKAFALRLLKGD